jgi:hypothetical protein
VHIVQGAPVRLVARGIGGGYRAAWHHRRQRRPVRPSTYRLRNRLRFKGPLLLEEVDAELRGIRAARNATA